MLASNSATQRVKTLAHELGHAMLHPPGEGRPESRAVLEWRPRALLSSSALLSESLPMTTASAMWPRGVVETTRRLAAIKESGARIQRAADQVISALDRVELADVV